MSDKISYKDSRLTMDLNADLYDHIGNSTQTWYLASAPRVHRVAKIGTLQFAQHMPIVMRGYGGT